MELRRALLLFAIVLGVAALVTSLSSSTSSDRSPEPPPQEPTVPAGPPPVVRFDADRAPTTKVISTDRASTITVSSEMAGDVRVDTLGLDAAVERDDPARFDVYETKPGRHRVLLDTPGGGVRGRSLGVLDIRRAR